MPEKELLSEIVYKEDGRYLIYYSWAEEKKSGQDDCGEEQCRN